jgi:acyl carrier protein
MNNLEKYNEAFTKVFGVKADVLGSGFSSDSVEDWDSVHQLNIIAELEDGFDLMLDPEDIVALTSYDAGLEVLRKYGVEI